MFLQFDSEEDEDEYNFSEECVTSYREHSTAERFNPENPVLPEKLEAVHLTHSTVEMCVSEDDGWESEDCDDQGVCVCVCVCACQSSFGFPI